MNGRKIFKKILDRIFTLSYVLHNLPLIPLSKSRVSFMKMLEVGKYQKRNMFILLEIYVKFYYRQFKIFIFDYVFLKRFLDVLAVMYSKLNPFILMTECFQIS